MSQVELREPEIIEKLQTFKNFYVNRSAVEIYRPTRVAIIDNGVAKHGSSFSNKIINGTSLVEDNEGHESPWFVAFDPHGTHMASFVHSMDPLCHLFSAKICERSGSIDPDTVADGILWAIEQNVDVISISLVARSTSAKLKKAVARAMAKNIVVFATRGDRGNNHEHVYPADYDAVRSISSFTSLGKSTESAETNADYFLEGENVGIPGEPSYLEPQTFASGSSVATAFAAGVASLVLSTHKMVKASRKMDRQKNVKAAFALMTEKDAYVRPWKVFKSQRMDAEKRIKKLEEVFAEEEDEEQEEEEQEEDDDSD